MPSKKQYNLVQNDENDTRIPLHSEEAFHRGIVFHAKFIGSMEVPRPTSRMEIVAAMRRIRYEFKAKGIKKKKVTLEVSVDGLKVTLRKKKKKQHWHDESKLALMHHPIYRIFYVSHDSHDLKIFSYIARDGSNNSFRCNVFKSSKKSQAMRVVRTVGQAFEVCHKLSLNNPPGGANCPDNQQQQQQQNGNGDKDADELSERQRQDSHDDYDEEFASLRHQPSPSSVHKDISLLGDSVDDSILDQPCPQIRRFQQPEITLQPSHAPINCSGSPARQQSSPLGQALGAVEQVTSSGAELTALKHEIQLLRERLDQQSQQTRAAVAHARLLQDQLAAETAARVEAQARTHQLLVQNKELLEHITALVSHLREHERLGGLPLSAQPSSGSGQGLAGLPQSAADIGLGQYNGGWESAAGAMYPGLTEPYYQPPSAYGYARPSSCPGYADDLRYQGQLWESLRLAAGNPYPPPSFVYGPASPRLLGSGLGLPPSGRARVSPVSSPFPSRARSSPRLQQQARAADFQQQRSRSLDGPAKEVSFIKPLPDKPRSESKGLQELVRPLRLNSPLPVTRTLKEEAVQTEPQPDPPTILLTEPTANGHLGPEDSGESEREDELAELPARPPLRRNSR